MKLQKINYWAVKQNEMHPTLQYMCVLWDQNYERHNAHSSGEVFMHQVINLYLYDAHFAKRGPTPIFHVNIDIEQKLELLR